MRLASSWVGYKGVLCILRQLTRARVCHCDQVFLAMVVVLITKIATTNQRSRSCRERGDLPHCWTFIILGFRLIMIMV